MQIKHRAIVARSWSNLQSASKCKTPKLRWWWFLWPNSTSNLWMASGRFHSGSTSKLRHIYSLRAKIPERGGRIHAGNLLGWPTTECSCSRRWAEWWIDWPRDAQKILSGRAYLRHQRSTWQVCHRDSRVQWRWGRILIGDPSITFGWCLGGESCWCRRWGRAQLGRGCRRPRCCWRGSSGSSNPSAPFLLFYAKFISSVGFYCAEE